MHEHIRHGIFLLSILVRVLSFFSKLWLSKVSHTYLHLVIIHGYFYISWYDVLSDMYMYMYREWRRGRVCVFVCEREGGHT